MTMYIIEADKTDRNWLEQNLSKNGYKELHFVDNFQAAKKELGFHEGENPSGIKLDIELFILNPGIGKNDGFDFCRKLKESFQYRDTPIIITSSDGAPGQLQMAFAFGATDFISKPLCETEVLTRIRSALKLKHEVDRRRSREKELLEVTKQLTDLNSMLARHSLIDGLTGCANRRCFDNSLDQEWRRAFRSTLPISVLMIDVDFFKQYNDSYGHQEGDSCLINIVNAIRDVLKRPSDLLSRYGGEEFVIILPETQEDGAKIVTEKVRKAIESLEIPHSSSKISDHVTASCGISTAIPAANINPSDIVRAADKALYVAKKSGRNRSEAMTIKQADIESKSAS